MTTFIITSSFLCCNRALSFVARDVDPPSHIVECEWSLIGAVFPVKALSLTELKVQRSKVNHSAAKYGWTKRMGDWSPQGHSQQRLVFVCCFSMFLFMSVMLLCWRAKSEKERNWQIKQTMTHLSLNVLFMSLDQGNQNERKQMEVIRVKCRKLTQWANI